MIYVILGQTASGKTSLALSLAKEFHLPVISADAFQCYKMMTIGTDKPSRDRVGDIPFYFYDEYEPDSPITVYDFQQQLRPILDDYQKKNQDVLVVGGTFLYIKALLFNYVFTQDEKRNEDYDSWSLEALQGKLKELDPKTYEEIDNRNPRRLIRAIQQANKGTTREEILSQNSGEPLYPVTFVRIDIDKEEGNRLIDERVDKMFEEGFEAEVRELLRHYPHDLRPFSSIGYKEVISAMDNQEEIDDKVKDLIKIHTHQYAKKQRTFLKNQFKDVRSGSKGEIKAWIEEDIQKRRKEM